MTLQLVLFVLGVVLLAIGADVFVRGASGLAERFGISHFVIGLVVVGFGTSTPELAVTLGAALKGNTDIALGNIVGSNIANIGLILGLSAVVAPLVIRLRLLQVELPAMIVLHLALFAMVWNGSVGRLDGLLLLAGFLAFMIFLVRSSPAESGEVQQEFAANEPAVSKRTWVTFALVVGGLALLMLGAKVAVDAAVVLAKLWGLSDLVIGLTVVAVGTSAPEIASSLAAARRGQSDIAIGNVVGSNLYNVLFILGATALVQPIPALAPTLLTLDLPVLVGLSVLLWPLALKDMRLTRGNGVLLLLAYAVYLVLLVRSSA
ncbi:MAG TPA: calcium/sodium antiporter [Patescibacteria group bacterium]|nr:calcium/sodium antiporter [Patescibacteria group bacterium]